MNLETSMIILIGAVVFLIIGLKIWGQGRHLLLNGIRTEAIVISNNRKQDDDMVMYYPVVKFKTEKDEWITQELNFGQYPKMREGKLLQVLYDPNAPQSVAVNSRFKLEILPRVLVGLGSVGLLLILLDLLDY